MTLWLSGVRSIAAVAALALLVAACTPSAAEPSGGTTGTSAEIPVVATTVVAVATTVGSPTSAPSSTATWLKGQLHMHTVSHGNYSISAEEMISRYEDLGFDFIVITDHNLTTDRTAYDGAMRVYVGVELSQDSDVCEPTPDDPVTTCRIHVSSLFSDTVSPGNIPWAQFGDATPSRLGQDLLDTAAALGGVAMVNHPTQYRAIDGSLLLEEWLGGAVLVEIANMGTEEWLAGTNDQPSTEAIWDEALSSGAHILGVASDDAHDPSQAGFGWVMVRAENTEESIRQALIGGDFYSSTGVVLSLLEVTRTELRIEVDDVVAHTIEFIGRGGQVLASVEATSAAFDLGELTPRGYVRAVVTSPGGTKAWTGPIRVLERTPSP